MTPETRAELEAIRMRIKAATPGPYHHGRRSTSSVFSPAHRVSANAAILALVDDERDNSEADFELFSNSITDIPRLLTIIDEQERDRERALAVLDLSSHYDSLEDACRQRMQAYITECDNAETARRNAFDEAISIAKQTINTLGWGSASGGVAQEIIVQQLEAARESKEEK